MPEKKEKKTDFEKKMWEAKNSVVKTAWKVWEESKKVVWEIWGRWKNLIQQKRFAKLYELSLLFCDFFSEV